MIADEYDEYIIKQSHKGTTRTAHIPQEGVDEPLCVATDIPFGRTVPRGGNEWKATTATVLPASFTTDCKRCLRMVGERE